MSIGDNRAVVLFNHIRALEALQEVKDEAAADFNERKSLAKADGFDTNVMAAILKRRKNGDGQTQAFDDMLREYEEALADQKHLPFDPEEVRRRAAGERKNKVEEGGAPPAPGTNH